MIALAYIRSDSGPAVIDAIRAAGFRGWVMGSNTEGYIPPHPIAYWDEPEDNPEAYTKWRTANEHNFRFVTYGNRTLARKLGVWHTDHTYIGNHRYPFKKQFWYTALRFITYPWHILTFWWAIRKSNAKALAVIQAFGGYDWVMPTRKQVEWQIKWWRRIMGKRLAAVAYFIWDAADPNLHTLMKDHQEVWPHEPS